MGHPSKGRRRKRKGSRGDITLIRDCVIYAQSLAAAKAGYEADPDGDGVHADQLGKAHIQRASQAMARILGTAALTPAGLEAKARVIPILLAGAYGSVAAEEEAFLLSFAADVRLGLAKMARRKSADPWRA